jgi:hypothetical protein
MKLWLDDQLDDPDCPERHTPEGWVGVKTALAACRLLATGQVTYISFDHDLGTWLSGYIVAKFIAKRAYEDKMSRLGWDLHSKNPVGADNIRFTMKNAERFWNYKEEITNG